MNKDYSIFSGDIIIDRRDNDNQELKLSLAYVDNKTYKPKAKTEVNIDSIGHMSSFNINDISIEIGYHSEKLTDKCNICGKDILDCNCIFPGKLVLKFKQIGDIESNISFKILDNKVEIGWNKTTKHNIENDDRSDERIGKITTILASTPSSVMKHIINSDLFKFSFVIVLENNDEHLKFATSRYYNHSCNLDDVLIDYVRTGLNKEGEYILSLSMQRFFGTVAIMKQETIHKVHETEYIDV